MQSPGRAMIDGYIDHGYIVTSQRKRPLSTVAESFSHVVLYCSVLWRHRRRTCRGAGISESLSRGGSYVAQRPLQRLDLMPIRHCRTKFAYTHLPMSIHTASVGANMKWSWVIPPDVCGNTALHWQLAKPRSITISDSSTVAYWIPLNDWLGRV